MKEELPLFVLWTEFLEWLLHKTEKFPKSVRFTFSSRIDNLALDALEKLIVARYSSSRKQVLHRLNLDLEKLRVLLRICNRMGYLDHKGYEYASRKIDEAGRMTGGWIKSQTENEV